MADRCTVLRHGRKIGTVNAAEADAPTLARMMVDREVTLQSRNAPRTPGAPVLELQSVSTNHALHDADLSDLSFRVHEGEVFGVAGVEGNGQRTLADLLAGLTSPTAGRIERYTPSSVEATPRAFTQGVIPEDRHNAGSAPQLSLQHNLIFRSFDKEPLSRRGWLQFAAIEAHCSALCDQFDIRSPGLLASFAELSGGNQQKAVIARELHATPTLLVAAHPTRGLDVGAIEFVYQVLRSYRSEGGAVVLISAELDEILALSDRFVVLFGGRASDVMRPDDADLTDIGLKMIGGTY